MWKIYCSLNKGSWGLVYIKQLQQWDVITLTKLSCCHNLLVRPQQNSEHITHWHGNVYILHINIKYSYKRGRVSMITCSIFCGSKMGKKCTHAVKSKPKHLKWRFISFDYIYMHLNYFLGYCPSDSLFLTIFFLTMHNATTFVLHMLSFIS